MEAVRESTARGMLILLAILEISEEFQQQRSKSRILIHIGIDPNSSPTGLKSGLHFFSTNGFLKNHGPFDQIDSKSLELENLNKKKPPSFSESKVRLPLIFHAFLTVLRRAS